MASSGQVQVGVIPLNSAMSWAVLDATVRRVFKVRPRMQPPHETRGTRPLQY